eukprot:SAG22_NODE_10817_length_514_cov_1.472289_2_plen_78_part_00
MTSLTGLYLKHNQITDLSPLSALTSLTELDLSDNRHPTRQHRYIFLKFYFQTFTDDARGGSCPRTEGKTLFSQNSAH